MESESNKLAKKNGNQAILTEQAWSIKVSFQISRKFALRDTRVVPSG